MKITAFNDLYSNQLANGTEFLVASSGSNAGFSPDVVGSPGDLTVVQLQNSVALGSNLGTGVTVGDVLTIIGTGGGLPVARFATPSNSVASNALLRTTGGAGAVTPISASGTAKTLMVGGANYFDLTLTANCTITFTGWAASGSYSEIGVRVTEDGTGGWTPTFSGVTWVGGTTPTHVTTALSTTEYVFWTDDGGATITGGQIGTGTSGTASPLTTKGDLYTYDTTNQRLAVGSNGQFVVADPVQAPGLRWTNNPAIGELLLSSTASVPPVFGDILTTTSQDDFVYGSR